MLNQDIDLVYLWSDLSDEKFRKKKEDLARSMDVPYEANNKGRFADNGELKYSLRSVEKHAPWVHRIFIVTNDQCPAWLDTGNPKITVINQADIMPEGSNPCFNSNAIEHCIVNIPGLSEYFLYANDDNFIRKDITPAFFYNEQTGYPVCRYTKKLEEGGLYKTMLRNSAELVYRKYRKMYDREPHHNIEAYTRTQILDCQAAFPEEIRRTIFSPFRTAEDVQKSIYNNYACATGTGHYKKVSRVDRWLPWYRKIIDYARKRYAMDSVFMIADQEDIMDTLHELDPVLFCINDGENVTDEDRGRLTALLESLYPESSGFERRTAQ